MPTSVTARVATTCAVVASSAWLLAWPQAPEQAPPVFRAGTDVVRLEVSVLDDDRRPVSGLTAADFRVLEDGDERPVVAFTHVDLPSSTPTAATAAWVTEAPLDTVSNVNAEDEGRLVVVVFDWSIRSYDQRLARKIAHAAIDGLGPADRAAVIFTDPASNAGVPQNFTSDRSLLRAAVDQPFATALIDLGPGGNAWKLDDPERYQSGGCLCGTCSLELLTRTAQAIRGVSHRAKVVLFIGTYVRTFEAVGGNGVTRVDRGGFALGAALQPGACHVPLAHAREQTERAMGEANATIHVVDPVGLETGMTTPLGAPERIRERQDSLPVIADLTGGRTVMSTNEPQAHVPAILDESGSYYVLGFTPAAADGDDRSHRIEVRVNRPDVSVKARDRYTRTEAPTSALAIDDAELVRTIGGVLPTSDVPLAMSVVPMITGSDGMAAAVVVGRVMGGASGESPDVLTVITAAFTPRGRTAASRRVALTPMAPASAGPDVLGLVSGLTLEPGPYEVRMGIERASGARGSLSTFVDIPDFDRDPLALSGILLHVEPEEPTEPRVEIDGMLPFVPTARRAFDRTDVVSTFLQVSQGTTRTEPLDAVTVSARVLDETGQIAREQVMSVPPDAFATHRSTNVRLSLPVQELPAGRYLLRVEANTADGSATRTVRFVVR